MKPKLKSKRRVKSQSGPPPYDVWVYYKGMPIGAYDQMLDRVAGRASSGSGYDFDRDLRDRSYVFSTYDAAKSCMGRLKTVPGVKRVQLYKP